MPCLVASIVNPQFTTYRKRQPLQALRVYYEQLSTQKRQVRSSDSRSLNDGYYLFQPPHAVRCRWLLLDQLLRGVSYQWEQGGLSNVHRSSTIDHFGLIATSYTYLLRAGISYPNVICVQKARATAPADVAIFDMTSSTHV